MALDWFAVDRCETAAQFGWFVGVWTGTVADIVIVALIASAPKLGSRRPPRGQLLIKTRMALRHSLWILALVWLAGACYAFDFLPCYTTMLAFGGALTAAVLVLLAMLTAANQIGARSVR
jgi:hypothetical protein